MSMAIARKWYSTAEVAEVVRICAEARLPIVPQGGNTGLVGGGVPPEDGHNIVLALGRDVDGESLSDAGPPGSVSAEQGSPASEAWGRGGPPGPPGPPAAAARPRR